MIGMLKGQIWEIQDERLILDVQGVGYQLNIPLNLLSKTRVGQELMVYTHLVVKEDELSLYAFGTLEEKHLFLNMLGVSGIGPKAALAILSSFATVQIKSAIASENINLLTKVPGIGKKTAQRLVMELRDKIGKDLIISANEHFVAPINSSISEAIETLLALGFSSEEAKSAIAKVKVDSGVEDLATEEQVRRALRELALKN